MKKLLAVAVAVALAVPLAAAAQEYAPPPPSRAYPPPAQAYPPQSPYANPAKQRDSWYIGFGLGTGNGSVEYVEGRYGFNATELAADDPTNGSFNLKAGATLTPRLLLGGDLTVLASVASGDGVDTSIGVSNLDVVLTFFPMERGFFVRGGVGLSTWSYEIDGGEFDGYEEEESGTNVMAGLGYAFWLGKQFNLTLNLDFSQQFYGGDDLGFSPESSRFVNAYVGFDWF
jgi:opacity protein-like surface antigen